MVIQKSLQTQLRDRINRTTAADGGSDINFVAKSLAMSEGMITNHLLVLSAAKNPKPLSDMNVMLKCSNILRSPIYDLPLCVPELLMTVLGPSCSQEFLNIVHEYARPVIRGVRQPVAIETGKFLFDDDFWNMCLRQLGACVFKPDVPTQRVGTHPWSIEEEDNMRLHATGLDEYVEDNQLFLAYVNSGKAAW
ncbi:uncharacterized protein LOC129576658 [Sitodiplosis mosellana]|uniref:uncharacterized protein LOC129576658 n=1 Tax=Sitodiplosis mosellana TaxID=263140 RepID=UPI0024443809|nr:uncharacterized protein LOC129576658 [Sitodiplosis mosellana]